MTKFHLRLAVVVLSMCFFLLEGLFRAAGRSPRAHTCFWYPVACRGIVHFNPHKCARCREMPFVSAPTFSDYRLGRR